MKEKCVFKESGIAWLGKIPKHWEIRQLKQIARIITGKTPADENNQDWGEIMPFVTPTDFIADKKYVLHTNRKLSQEGIQKLKSVIIPKNSILVTCIASIGKLAINMECTITNQQINSVIPNKELVSEYFIFYQLLKIMPSIEKYFCGYSVLPIINKGDFSNVSLVIPPIEEQKAIADFLDKKCELIEEFIIKKEQLITLLEEKKQALINEAVSKGLNKNAKFKESGIDYLGQIPTYWEVKKLKSIFSLGSGLNITKENFVPYGIPCVSYGEIHSKYPCRLDTTIHKLPFVSEKYLKSNPKSLLTKGDFIFADTSEDIEGSGNFTSILSDEPLFAGYHTIILKPKADTINPLYFSFLFDSLSIRTQIRKEVCGVKVFSITKSILKEILCIIPPLEEQKAIATYLDTQTQRISSIITKIKAQIKLMREYKSSLISESVCGRMGLNKKG